MRLFLLLVLVSCIKLQAPTIIAPIALVKYKNTIYHCEEIKPTNCGHSIHCGDMSLHCADNLTIEYL